MGYLLYGAVLLRVVLAYPTDPKMPPVGLALAFGLGLHATLPAIAQRLPAYAGVGLALQAGLVTALMVLLRHVDFFGVLYAALSTQVAAHFPPRLTWPVVAGFAGLMTYPLVRDYGPAAGLALAAVFAAICVFVVTYVLTAERARRARLRNQALLAELTEANRQLAEHAASLEQLAAARERSRLARELHDSVTQTIFSLTLTTQSARLLWERDPARVAAQLDRLEALAGSALAEMRTLVTHLRPVSAGPEALPGELRFLPALRQHLSERHAQGGPAVVLEVGEPGPLAPAEAAALLRIIQEALNNVARHAGTGQAFVHIHLAPPAWVEVRDHGCGFDPRAAEPSGHLGLAGMRERAAEVGWRLSVSSAPGAGTQVRAERVVEEARP